VPYHFPTNNKLYYQSVIADGEKVFSSSTKAFCLKITNRVQNTTLFFRIWLGIFRYHIEMLTDMGIKESVQNPALNDTPEWKLK
jgi:hypothetical protein